MFCDSCGANIGENQNFCPTCGKALRARSATPSPTATYVPRPPRVAGNIKVLGILWIAVSVLHLIPGLVLMTMFHGVASFLPPEAPIFLPHLLTGIGFGLSLISLLGAVAGWGLLTWQPWARMLAILLGVLHLLNVPFGTALGIYTLWVLLPAESEREYAARAASSFRAI